MELNSDLIFSPAIPSEIHGVKLLRQTSDVKLAELGVTSWPLSVFFPIYSLDFFMYISLAYICRIRHLLVFFLSFNA